MRDYSTYYARSEKQEAEKNLNGGRKMFIRISPFKLFCYAFAVSAGFVIGKDLGCLLSDEAETKYYEYKTRAVVDQDGGVE